jgi:hypothetical protein
MACSGTALPFFIFYDNNKCVSREKYLQLIVPRSVKGLESLSYIIYFIYQAVLQYKDTLHCVNVIGCQELQIPIPATTVWWLLETVHLFEWWTPLGPH